MDLRAEVLKRLDQEHGHQGIERTTELVRQCCYWPGMSREIAEWCKGCELILISLTEIITKNIRQRLLS